MTSTEKNGKIGSTNPKEKGSNMKDDRLLYQQTIDKIYELIDTGEVKLGEKFPPERQLTQKWGISRNTLRDAFHILEHRGLIVSKHGSGRYLRNKVKLDSPSGALISRFDNISQNLERYSLFDIYYTRQLLEPKIVENVARYASEETIKTIRNGFKAYKKILNESGNTDSEVDIHRLYASGCDNYFLVEMAMIAYEVTEDLMRNRFEAEYFRRHSVKENITDHNLIIEAIERRDTEAANRLMFKHLQRTLDMMI